MWYLYYMKIIITEKQLKYILESDEVNQYGFTQDEMKQIEDSVRNEIEQHYKWLKEKVEKEEEQVSWMKERLKMKDLPDEIADVMVKQYIEPKLKQYEIDKKNLEEFDFDTQFRDGVERDIHGGAYSMSWKIRYEKWKKEELKRNLTKEDIIALFVTSLEGGSNYWYLMDLPKDIKTYGQSTSEAVGEYILQGGAIQFYDREEYYEVKSNLRNGYYNIGGGDDIIDKKSYQEDLESTKLGYVDMDKILESISVIKKDYPEIWENILLEQADAGDADVFLQLCVMGDIVYG